MTALLVLCTAPSEEVGASLARGLVDARLAACVSLIPSIRSFYRWKGRVEDEGEVQLLIKTTSERFAALSEWVAAAHPYEVPELIGVPIEAGSSSYLGWLREQVADLEGGEGIG